MKRVILVIICFVLLIYLSGCSDQSFPTLSYIKGAEKTKTAQYIIPSTEIVSSSTPTSSQGELTATLVKTEAISTPTHKVKNTDNKNPTSKPVFSQIDSSVPLCKNNGNPGSSPNDFGIEGTIIYKNIDRILLMGRKPFSTSELYVLENESIENFGISPDGKWLAFTYEPKRNDQESSFEPIFIMLSNNGDSNKVILNLSDLEGKINSLEFLDYMKGEWNDNQSLNLRIYSRMKGSTKGNLISQRIINVFTGEWQEYPSWKQKEDMLYLWSPDKSKAFYSNANYSDPNLTQYFIVFGEEVRSQKRVEMTHLLHEDSTKTFLLNGLKWSPDNRYIAMVFNVSNKSSDPAINRIFVYDTEVERYIFQCDFPRMGAIHENFINYPLDIFWSPDGTSFAANVIPSIYPNSIILLFDLNTNQVNKVTYGSLLGWSMLFKP